MSKIAIIAKLTARPGERQKVIDALEPMFAQVDLEEGTEIYALHEDSRDDDVVWFYELYTDGDSAGAHGASDAMTAVGAALGDHLAGPPELIFAKPLRAKGIGI